MNQILLFDSDFTDEHTVVLTGRRFTHLQEIVKPAAGDSLKVGLTGGLCGKGGVTSIDEGSITLDVVLTDTPPLENPVSLILAVPRPKVLRRVIQTAVSMGVKRICLIRSWRVDKSYLESPVLSDDSLLEDTVLALEQSCDTVLPEISVHHLFKPFVEDLLPVISNGKMKILAHPYTNNKLPADIAQPAVVVIGPEGGFIGYEVTMLENAGFRAYSMGKRILRVEAAVPAILARLGM